MVGDVIGVLDHLAIDRAHLVGHDWGAAIALADRRIGARAGRHRSRRCRWAIPRAFRTAGLAPAGEVVVHAAVPVPRRRRAVAERGRLPQPSGSGRAIPTSTAVVARLAEPGALTASLNLYRAILPPESLVAPPLELPPVPAPAMGVWSSGDLALTEEAMTGSAAYVAGPWRYERLDGVGHWMQLEAPEAVNALLLDFLGQHRDRGSSRQADLGAVAAGGG